MSKCTFVKTKEVRNNHGFDTMSRNHTEWGNKSIDQIKTWHDKINGKWKEEIREAKYSTVP